MLRGRTLLVLGAGASVPYGFPTGVGLRERIITSFDNFDNSNHPAALAARCPASDFRDFVESFKRSAEFSVDAFLSRRKEYSRIGKVAIATVLCAFERPENLWVPAIRDGDWYQYFWNRFHGTRDLARDSNFWSNCRVITFNYDRSLEFYLYNAVRSNYGASPSQALDEIRKLRILHVYGQLGELTDNGASNQREAGARPYVAEISESSLAVAAHHLRVVPEMRDDDEVFQTCRDWFLWADTVCFLGFGFDKLNCKRLGFREIERKATSDGMHLPMIYATTFGLSADEIDTATRQINNASHTQTSPFQPYHGDCLGAIRHWGIWEKP